MVDCEVRIAALEAANWELGAEAADLRLELVSAGYRYRGAVGAWGRALGVDASFERVPENILAKETAALRARLAAAEAEVARYRAVERMEQRGGYIHLRKVA